MCELFIMQIYKSSLYRLPIVTEWQNWHLAFRVQGWLILSRKYKNWPPGIDIWLFTNESIVFSSVHFSEKFIKFIHIKMHKNCRY